MPRYRVIRYINSPFSVDVEVPPGKDEEAEMDAAKEKARTIPLSKWDNDNGDFNDDYDVETLEDEDGCSDERADAP